MTKITWADRTDSKVPTGADSEMAAASYNEIKTVVNANDTANTVNNIAFGTSIPFSNVNTLMAAKTITQANVFTKNVTDQITFGACQLRLTANGNVAHVPDFSAFKKISNGIDWDNTNAALNLIKVWYDGIDHWYEVKDGLLNNNTSTLFQDTYETIVKFDKNRAFTSVKTMLGNETLSLDLTNGVPGAIEVREYIGDGNQLIFNDPSFSIAAIDTVAGEYISVVLMWSGNKVIVSFSGSGSIAVAYTFVNTHSMVIAADTDYLQVLDDNYYFNDGVGVDKPYTVLMWVKMPATIVANKMICLIHSVSGASMYVSVSSVNSIQITQLNGANNITRNIKPATHSLVANTWYFIGISYDGSEAGSGFEFTVDGSAIAPANLQGADVGTYVGIVNPMPAEMKLRFPNASALYGKYNLIRMFDRKLTPAEIATNATGIVPVACPGTLTANLISEHSLNQDATAAKGLDGTLEGTPTFDTDLPT